MRRRRCSVGSCDPGGLLRGLDHRVGWLLSARRGVQLPGVHDALGSDRRGSVQANGRTFVRPPGADRSVGLVPVSRGAGRTRTECGTLLREDPAQAWRWDDRRSVRMPGLRDEVGTPDGTAARAPRPCVRQVRAGGTADGPTGTLAAVPRSAFGVLTAPRLTAATSRMRPVRYADIPSGHDDSRIVPVIRAAGRRADRDRSGQWSRGSREQGWL